MTERTKKNAARVIEQTPLSNEVEVWLWSDDTMTIRDRLRNRWHVTLDLEEQEKLHEYLETLDEKESTGPD